MMAAPACVLIFLLHRHGMRHPFVHFEGIGDPLVPDQLAMLTDRGERQMIGLGKYLAAKHRANSTGAPMGEISPKAVASSVTRCVESSKIVFKSFLDTDVDVSIMKTDYSKVYFDMIARNIDLMMSLEFKTEHGNLVSDYIIYLNEQANSTKETMQQKYQIVESLLTAMKNGHELPPYADEETLERCLNLMNCQLMEGFEELLYTEIFEDMAVRLKSPVSRSPNFVGFSVSDIHIIAVLERLGLGIQHWPDYGSAYEIRIHDDCSVVLDELNNSPDGEITERSAIRTTTLGNLRRKVQEL